MSGPLRRTGPRNQQGSILILSTVGVVLALIAASLAVDLGFLAHEIRVDQKVADLAALDAARALPAPTATLTAAAQASAARNGFPATPGFSVTAVEGVKSAGGGDLCQAQPGAGTVCVTATSPHENFFPFVPGGQSKTRVAVAGGSPEAAFSVGSTLASIDTQKSFLDPILGKMLGPVASPALNMSAVSYDGVATGSVSLAALQTNLLAMGYDVGTTDKLFANSVRVAALLTATAQALTAQGNSAAAAEINSIPLASIPNAKTVNLGRLVGLSQPGSNSALDTRVNAFSLLTGAAQVANGSSFVDVPGITVALPLGLGNVGVKLSAIEPAQTAKGPVGAEATTSQVKLRLSVSLLQTGALALLAPVTFDLDFTAGEAKATLTDIDCGASPSITISPTTSGATVSGGGTILPPLAGTLTVAGSLAATVAGPPLEFDYPTEFAPVVGSDPDGQHVGAATLDLSPTTATVSGSGGLLAGTVAGVVQTLLPTILTAFDSLGSPLLQPVLKVLGLDVAAADVVALDMYDPPPSCGSPRLLK